MLGDPAPDRVLGHTSEEDLASLEIDEEQDIDLSKAHGVDGEEVARERAGSLGAKELCPRRTRSAWCRFEAMTSKHVPDTRRRDGDAELSTFANDAEIAPPRVLARRTMSSTTSSSSALWAPPPTRGNVQCRATSSRCQRSSVAGVTRNAPQRSVEAVSRASRARRDRWGRSAVAPPGGASLRAGDEGRRSRRPSRRTSDRSRGAGAAFE